MLSPPTASFSLYT